MKATFQFGIEEEFFLADASTRGTARRAVTAFHKAVKAHLPQVEREMLRSQVEISSPPSTSFSEAREHLANLRASLAEIGRSHGLLVLAAGTHPLALWSRQQQTPKDRYDAIMAELQMVGRRNVVCGMHVHVEVPRPERRVDLMNRLLPFTPLLLALSASSPFWQGRNMGVAAYRMSAFGEMPRTGLPDLFNGEEDYGRYVEIMTRVGAVADASFLWWTLRPSIRFPTLELRIADSCTRLEDTIAIAALFRCLVRRIDRQPDLNRGLTGASRAIAVENLWRAQRDGIRAQFIDEPSGNAKPFAETLGAITTLVAEDAEVLGCRPELDRTHAIAADGTSSDRQLAIFAAAGGSANNANSALVAVVDWLADVTAGQTAAPQARQRRPSNPLGTTR